MTLWTGVESKALRLTLRMTVEAFAERLGAGVRTANWEARRASIKPRPDLQAALETLLEHSSGDERARFWVLLSSARAESGEGTDVAAEPATLRGIGYLTTTAASPTTQGESGRRRTSSWRGCRGGSTLSAAVFGPEFHLGSTVLTRGHGE